MEHPYSDYHIMPINDLKEHDHSFYCWCSPEIQGSLAPYTVVHHALDNRERIDWMNPLPKC